MHGGCTTTLRGTSWGKRLTVDSWQLTVGVTLQDQGASYPSYVGLRAQM